MIWDWFAGNWKQLIGPMQDKWGKLNHLDLVVAAGDARAAYRSPSEQIWLSEGPRRSGTRRIRAHSEGSRGYEGREMFALAEALISAKLPAVCSRVRRCRAWVCGHRECLPNHSRGPPPFSMLRPFQAIFFGDCVELARSEFERAPFTKGDDFEEFIHNGGSCGIGSLYRLQLGHSRRPGNDRAGFQKAFLQRRSAWTTRSV